jgi:hypothetical protein
MKLGLPPAPLPQASMLPEVQVSMLPEAQVSTPLPSPPQSDDESDDWRYEC